MALQQCYPGAPPCLGTVLRKLGPQLFKLLRKRANSCRIVGDHDVFLVAQHRLPCVIEAPVHEGSPVDDRVLVMHVGDAAVVAHWYTCMRHLLYVAALVCHL